jgi:hypothetical protein
MKNVSNATLGRKQFRQLVDETLTPYFLALRFQKTPLHDEEKSAEIVRMFTGRQAQRCQEIAHALANGFSKKAR